ncbi:hypothetical protein DPMN_175103 [Dreissena polymorpha]|uniref:Ig-like domain-containing protein n=1 Tax=Dreissena polymorpha TaxID=45954 RepID=A0A9D4IGZ3_DREPO|nr:hypothetical protein DPMN_175103 [Dreissena polymorpha]
MFFADPRARLSIIPKQTPVSLSAWYQLAIRCQLADSNTQCTFKWATREGTVENIDVLTTNMTYTESVLNFNVSASSSGNRITCPVKFEEFSLQLKVDHIIDLPSKHVFSNE